MRTVTDHDRDVDAYVITIMRPALERIARTTSAILLPVVAVALATVAIWLAVINTVALHSYLAHPDTPLGLAWAAAFAQEAFILTGEATLLLWAVALRRPLFLSGGIAMTIAGNASAMWWHWQHAANTAKPALLMIVVFGALALFMFVAITHRAVGLVAHRRQAATVDDDAPTILTIAQAARDTGIPDSTIRSWVKTGKITNRNPDDEPMRVLLRDVLTIAAERVA